MNLGVKSSWAKFIITLIAVVVPLGLAGFFALRSDLFKIAKVNVEILNASEIGSDNLAADLKEVITEKMQSYIGQDIWNVSLRNISERALLVHWVNYSEIHRQLPDIINVRVQLKPVVSVLVTEKGQMLPVSTGGDLMDQVSSGKVPNVPVLIGSQFEKSEEARKKAIQLIADIPNTGLFSKSNISEVHYKPQEGFWVTMMHSGLHVKLGEEQVGIKSERVAQVLEYIDSHSLDARVIDANLSKKVLVRLRKEP